MSSAGPVEAPVAIGLMLCDQVIIDRGTDKPSAIGIFTGLGVVDFSERQRFSVFAMLTNGQGIVPIDLIARQLDVDESVYHRTFFVRFSDPLAIVNFHVRVRSIVFPGPAWYDFQLLVGNEQIASRRVRVYSLAEEE